jgi:uncharacterized protein (TIGR04255 family)
MTAMTLDLAQADSRIAGRRTVSMAICQVRYDQQTAVSSGPTALAFHEKLDGANGPYPKIEEAEGANRIVMGIGPGRPIAETSRSNGWSFSSSDEQWSLALLPGNMGLQSNSYNGWDDFLQRETAALEALSEIVRPSFEQRLGLRFVDTLVGENLDVATPAGWEPYISGQFLGPLLNSELTPATRATFQQVLIDIGDDAVCNLRTGTSGPNDDGTVDFAVDCDLFRERGQPFDLTAILSTISRFKEQADRLFQAVVTPALLEKLKS